MLPFSEVYNMPIYLRKFYFKRLQKHYTEEKEVADKAQKKIRATPPSFKK